MSDPETPQDASYEDAVDRYRAGTLSRDEFFSRLFDRYYYTLVRLGLHMGFSADESRDLAQDSFIRFYSYLDQLEGSSSLRALLLTTYRNLAYNHIRSKHASKRGGQEVPDDALAAMEAGGPSAEQSIIDKEQVARIRDALVAALTTEEAALVMSRLVEGRTYSEIADVLALPPQVIQARLQRALVKLRRHLAGVAERTED